MISISIIILVLIQIFIGILSASNDEIIDLSNREDLYCITFNIPGDDAVCKPEKLFEVLKNVALQMDTNIIRTKLQVSDLGYEVVKYVLLSDESNYYDQFKVSNGKKLSIKESQDVNSDSFISSKSTGQYNQIGTIKSHMYQMSVSIKPLFQQFYYFKASGLYYAELPQNITKEEFLLTLQDNLEKEFGIILNSNVLKGGKNNIRLPYEDTKMYQIIVFVVMSLIFVLVIYYFFRETKQIAIMKLHGISIWKIVFSLQKELHIVYLSTIFVAVLIHSLLVKDVLYTWSVMKNCVWLYVSLFGIMTTIGILFVKHCNVYQLLKGKSGTNGILQLNYLVKIICLLAITYLGQSAYNNYLEVQLQKSMLINWTVAEQYGIFYPIYYGNEMTDEEQLSTDVTISQSLYLILNNMGALYIDATRYEPKNISQYENMGQLSVKVNPNYLSKFPILDTNGDKINITEDTTDWILLVPDFYKGDEAAILKDIANERAMYNRIDKNIYKIDGSDNVINQKLRIIWTDDNQQIFSFNSEVFPEQNNMISNAIVQVITENNSYTSDRECFRGSTNDSLKIKLTGTSKETYYKLQDDLMHLKLEDNLKYIVSVNENMQEKINQASARLISSLKMAMIIFCILIFISVQNCIITFDKYKKDYIIKKIYGWNWLAIYKKQIAINIIILLLSTCIYYRFVHTLQGSLLMIIESTLVVTEILVLWTSTKVLEKIRLVNILKGE